MDAIRVSRLTKAYGAKRAVDGVSLTVGAGDVFRIGEHLLYPADNKD